jgi:hypothetical protein
MSFIYCHLNFHANLLRPWPFPLNSLIHPEENIYLGRAKTTYSNPCDDLLSLFSSTNLDLSSKSDYLKNYLQCKVKCAIVIIFFEI